ncbi:hypothetical protein ACOMHN_027518 [Nucella lapillus]
MPPNSFKDGCFRVEEMCRCYLNLTYHHSLNQLVGVRHPNLWHFIRKLKDSQAESETKLTAAEQGDAPRQRRRKWRILAARICRLKQQYTNGARNLDSYWRAISHVIWRPLA